MAVVAKYEDWVGSAPGRTDQAGYQRYLQNMKGVQASQGAKPSSPAPSQKTSKGVVAGYDDWAASSKERASAGREGYQRYLQNMGANTRTTPQVRQAGNQAGRTDSILWKPNSESRQGRLAVLHSLPGNTELVLPDGQRIPATESVGASNGYANTYFFGAPGQQLPQGTKLSVGGRLYNVPNPGGRFESLSTAGGGGSPLDSSGGSQLTPSHTGFLPYSASADTDIWDLTTEDRARFGANQQTRMQNIEGLAIPDSKLYDASYIMGVLQQRPDLPGANVGGTYYRNPAYNPNAGDTQPAPAPSGGGTGGGGGHGGFSGGGSSAGGSRAARVEPQTREVVGGPGQKPYETVQGQIVGLLEDGNPYIERARHFGRESAAERGLLNSTLASQSAEAAAIDAAFPIASQDAQTYFTQAVNNQNVTNRFRENEMLHGYEMERLRAAADLDLRNALSKLDAGHSNTLQLQYNELLAQNYSNGYLTPQQQEIGADRISALYGRNYVYGAAYAGL